MPIEAHINEGFTHYIDWCCSAYIAGTLDVAMRKLDVDFVCTLADSLAEAVNHGCFAQSDITDTILPRALSVLRHASDYDSLDAWAEVASACVPWLPNSTTEAELIGLATSASAIEQTAEARVLACKLIGAIVPYISSSAFNSYLRDKVNPLCQDTDSEVRAAMCNELPNICTLLGPQQAAQLIIPALEELASDEEAYVRGVTLTTLSNLLQKLSADTVKSSVLPLMHRCVSEASDPQRITPSADYKGWSIASRLTKVLDKLENNSTLQQWNHSTANTSPGGLNLFVKAWSNLGLSADAEVRKLIAQATPNVIRALGPRHYGHSVHETLAALADDPEGSVRAEVASVLGDVSEAIGRERSHKFLKQAVLKLLGDTGSEAPDKIAPHLSRILRHLKVPEESTRMKTSRELLNSMVTSIERFRDHIDWRGEQHVLQGISEIADSLPHDKLPEIIFPICFRCLNYGAVPLRKQAASTLCVAMRQSTRNQRRDMGLRLVKDFARSRSCLQRLIFAEICNELMEQFSARYFRETFMQFAIELLADKVNTVRISACALIPELRRRIRLSEDTILFEQLYHHATQRTADSDRIVRDAAEEVFPLFKSVGDFSKQSAAWLDQDSKKEESEEPELAESSSSGSARRNTLGEKSGLRRASNEGILPGYSKAMASSTQSSSRPATSMGPSSSTPSGSGRKQHPLRASLDESELQHGGSNRLGTAGSASNLSSGIKQDLTAAAAVGSKAARSKPSGSNASSASASSTSSASGQYKAPARRLNTRSAR